MVVSNLIAIGNVVAYVFETGSKNRHYLVSFWPKESASRWGWKVVERVDEETVWRHEANAESAEEVLDSARQLVHQRERAGEKNNSLADVLKAIPNVGLDSDFERK